MSKGKKTATANLARALAHLAEPHRRNPEDVARKQFTQAREHVGRLMREQGHKQGHKAGRRK
ncbi:MAG TPA: hypothetical protein VKR60_06275 [Candidatus Sulfotelmatobacter sp.]|nr:hypothetical protein [Candidatus Sulfotelmatobacter sp.]